MECLISAEPISDEQNKSLCRSLDTIASIHGVRPHATDNRADEVDIDNGVDVYYVKYHRDAQEPEPTEAGHHKEWMMAPRSGVVKVIQAGVR